MDTALVVFALIAAVIGVAQLTPATIGVGLIAGACFLAILARLVQAERIYRKPRPE